MAIAGLQDKVMKLSDQIYTIDTVKMSEHLNTMAKTTDAAKAQAQAQEVDELDGANARTDRDQQHLMREDDEEVTTGAKTTGDAKQHAQARKKVGQPDVTDLTFEEVQQAIDDIMASKVPPMLGQRRRLDLLMQREAELQL